MLNKLSFAATASLMIACAQTDFTGSGRDKNRLNTGEQASNQSGQKVGNEQDTGHGYVHTPITPTLEKSGWVSKDTMKDLKELFNYGAADSPSASGNIDSTGSNNKDSKSPGEIGDATNPNSPKDQGDEVPSFSEGDVGVFWVPCEGDTESNNKRGSITGPLGAQVRLAGEFCPQRNRQEALTVLFVVDYSGSMTNPPEGPNDPGESCGRLRAADALLKKFAGAEYNGYNLAFGLVAFSNDASVRLPLQDIAGIQRSLTAGMWCGSDGSSARTNYRAAFETSSQSLSAVSGRVAVYFISDGSPTTGAVADKSPEQSGLDAAIALRSSRPDKIVLNAIFLGYNSTIATDPKGYLEQITGDPKRVRFVDTSDGLVEAVKSLDPGLPSIQKSDVTGSLLASGTSRDVAIASLLPHKAKAGTYVYMTQAFKLSGEIEKTVINRLTVQAITGDGKKLTSEALIDFKATP